MSKTLVLAGAAATGAVGYAIACWLARMTDYAERRDAERYHPPCTAPSTTGPRSSPVRDVSLCGSPDRIRMIRA